MQTALSGSVAALLLAAPSLASTDPIQDALDVSEYELVTIQVPSTPGHDVTIDVQIEGQPFSLDLERTNLRSDDFQVLLQVEGGGYEPYTPDIPNTFRGDASGVSNSIVSASLIEGQMQAYVRTDFGTWGIQPLSDFDASAADDVYVVYAKEDILDKGWTCGVSDSAVPPSQQSGQTYGTGLALTEMALDADWEYFLARQQNVNNVLNDIEFVINTMTGIYENDVQVTFEITSVIVRTTSNDPYTTSDPSNLLNQFRNHWNGQQSFIRRDIAHLMTGKNIDGGVIGIAYLGAICSPGTIGYGLSETTFSGNSVNRVGLTAHEVGHNYNAGHCDGTPTGACRIMCSGLGGCNNNLQSFGLTSRNSITNFANSINCNPELAAALPLPFFDDMNSSPLSRDLWPVRQGTAISTQAQNEPSGNSSLQLDAVGSQPFGDDWVRSNVILMGAASSQNLEFYSQHRGVENGERLLVDYLNAQDDWVQLYEVVSDGVTQSNFVFHSVSLPSAAYHDGFRFRFTTDVNETNDDWYIDDVAITDGTSCGNVQNYCLTSPNSNSAVGALMSQFGSVSVAANDLVLAASPASSNQPGIFYYGPNQVQSAFGNGVRCVGGTVTRLPVIVTDVFGFAFFSLDQTALPPNGAISAGDTVNFQFWFRDPASGGAAFNLSDGLEITFCP